MEPVIIEFRGFAAKKNQWRPRAGGKGIFLDSTTRQKLTSLELQVPGDVRDLKLEHPDMEWFFTYTHARIDRDNIKQTILDILVKYGVLAGDNFAHLNGLEITHPAVRGEYESIKVILLPRNPGDSPRYVKPVRKKVALHALAGQEPEPLEDVPEESILLWEDLD
jgi:hypothetical protein